MSPADKPRSRTTRRPDRAELIIAAAARLFSERGYNAVSLDDIGEVVGITGPGVYRHFSSKEELLTLATKQMVERYRASLLEAVEGTETLEDRLIAMVDRSVSTQVEDVNFWVASTELKHVSRDLMKYIGRHRAAAIQLWIDVLLELHPFLSTKEANFMVECGTSLTMPTLLYYQPSLSRARVIEVLSRMSLAAFVLGPESVGDGRDASRQRPPARSETGHPRSEEPPARTSSRERILSAAISLFREYGFKRTGIDEIGAAAGITGPAVYRHFRNKEDILFNAMSRVNEVFAAGVSRSLEGTPIADEAFERLVDSYIDAVIDAPDTIAVYWSQRDGLSTEQRSTITRGEHAYVQEWVDVLRKARPEIDDAEARTMVYGSLGMMNGYWQGWSPPLPPEQARAILKNVVLAALTKS